MKSLLQIIIAFFLCFFCNDLFAQKVKFKRKEGTYYVEKTAYINQSCKNLLQPPCVLSSSTSGDKLFSVMAYPYTKTQRVNKGNGWVTEERKAYYYQVKAIDTEHEFYTRQVPKQMVRAMYNANILTENGKLDIPKLEEFIKIFGEDKPI